jgi:integrase
MSLNINQIKALKPREKAYKTADANGLYLEVTPNGSKLWRLKYRIAGKEKRLAFGAWPEVSLSDARAMREQARSKIRVGIDPGLERKREKAAEKIGAANTFALIAEEYIDTKLVKEGKAPTTIKKARYFLQKLTPAIGQMPITDVDSQMLLAVLKRLEAKGNYETAKKSRSFASRVFRYAIWTGRGKLDPAESLKGALVTPKAKHYAAILEPKKFAELLRAIDTYEGYPVTKYALLIAPHVFVRPGELRHAEWSEFDFDQATWTIPEGKMKARREHAVPLSKQVAGYLQELGEMTGTNGYVFPSFYTPRRPMSENTINVAFRRMGFGKDEIVAHGLRSTASTLLNESGKWDPDAIERALAHGDSNAVRGAYHRGTYWKERVKMAQWWSDYLDGLREYV